MPPLFEFLIRITQCKCTFYLFSVFSPDSHTLWHFLNLYTCSPRLQSCANALCMQLIIAVICSLKKSAFCFFSNPTQGCCWPEPIPLVAGWELCQAASPSHGYHTESDKISRSQPQLQPSYPYRENMQSPHRKAPPGQWVQTQDVLTTELITPPLYSLHSS